MKSFLRASAAAVLLAASPSPIFASADEAAPPKAQIGEWGVDTTSM